LTACGDTVAVWLASGSLEHLQQQQQQQQQQRERHVAKIPASVLCYTFSSKVNKAVPSSDDVCFECMW
jgi:hypothetical protein